jgi:NAD+ synthase (glutamine-hydrolysing)
VDLAVSPEVCVSSYAIDDLHMQTARLDAVEAAVENITAASADLAPVLLIGAFLRHSGRLYNCALAIALIELLGVAPKSFLPNYREYYEKRWFAHGRNSVGQTIRVGGREAPFGSDLIFAASDFGNNPVRMTGSLIVVAPPERAEHLHRLVLEGRGLGWRQRLR